MNRHFEVALAEQASAPVSFTLARKRFTCLPMVPAGVQADLADWQYTTPRMLSFIEGVLKNDAEVARFQTFVHGKTPLIPSALLVQVVDGLIAEYAARPFGTPKRSPNGRSRTSTTSKGSRRPKASTTSR
jgi:hypothetical protein